MRLVCTLNDQKKGYELSSFLIAEGIENQLEISKNTDWGSVNYGDMTARIWVIDEDDFENALRWVDLYQKDPTNVAFSKKTPEPILQGPTPKLVISSKTPTPSTQQPPATMTIYLLLACCILFFATEMTTPTFTFISSTTPALSLPAVPLYSAPIKKRMLYDYPYAYEIVDKLVNLFGVERLQEAGELPVEGRHLLEKFHNTPYWHGFYDTLLHRFGNSEAKDSNLGAPLFEKIRLGEFWRLFSPSLLHSDLLHIAFNMIWLVILGKQLELRLGIWRYLLFILITGIFSNTAQYLISGPNFIGFSGILCAMLAFIWVRQRKAAWEGYQLDGLTMKFMTFFILGMFVLQAISFYLETTSSMSISPGVANTAHLSGALAGFVLGQFNQFEWKS